MVEWEVVDEEAVDEAAVDTEAEVPLKHLSPRHFETSGFRKREPSGL
jgi:hypothetical protein